MSKSIRVHVIDDSASVRKLLKMILESDPAISVINISSDPVFAKNHLQKEWPDVFILDIEMPRMDGISFLKEIMGTRPTPVIICSALTDKNARLTIEAMSLGAVQVITKPKIGIRDFFTESAISIIDAVKSAAQSNIARVVETEKPSPDNTSGSQQDTGLFDRRGFSHAPIIAIGASAGGTHALERLLPALPQNTPGIVIVQHMPEKFTAAFAQHLDSLCSVNVHEASTGDRVVQGDILVAPGNRHMVVLRDADGYHVLLKDGPLVSRHRPSVDVLFRSVAKQCGADSLGIILTGMGDDGAAGMLEMREAGAYCAAQDRESCTVFGMPRAAIMKGAVDKVLNLDNIPSLIGRFSRR